MAPGGDDRRREPAPGPSTPEPEPGDRDTGAGAAPGAVAPTGEGADANGGGDATDGGGVEAAERRRRIRRIALLLTPYSLAVVAGLVARGLAPTLLVKSPLTLIALDARNLHLAAVASLVDPVPYYLVATTRLLAVDPFMFLIGRQYGDAGVRWVERRFTSLKPTIELLEKLFQKAGWLAVAAFPGPLICTLAGAAGMRVGIFLAFNVTGTLLRVALLREVGVALEGPVEAVRSFFDRYLIWATLVSIGLVVLWVWLDRIQGRAETESPEELAEELEHEIEAGEGAGAEGPEEA